MRLRTFSVIPNEPIISNVRYAFDELTIPRFRRTYNPPKRPKENSALDTETAYGQAYLITDSDSNVLYPSHWNDIIEWLYDTERFRYINWLYNLDYDVRAILSWLPDELLFELWTVGSMKVNEVEIEYIPHKYFSIKDGKRRVAFYDLAQFFNESLEKASLRWLNEGKHPIDSERIDYDPDYRRDKFYEIERYCIQDSHLTKRLADINQDLFAKVGVTSNRWYSSAYIAERYFLSHIKFPTMHLKDAQRYAYYSYAGGRFEVFRRGYFPQVYKYDIHSAYPFAMRDLPNLDLGEWRFLHKYDDSADLAFVKVKIKNRQGYVQPLHYKIRQLVTYPVADTHIRIITKPELDLIREFDLADVTVLNGWHFYNTWNDRPFRIIDDLYNWRQEIKQDDDPREWVIKIIMNSIYGKTIQINPRRPDETAIKVGNLFIPAYASEITARTRCTLLRQCLERELSPLAFFTDAIVLEEQEGLPAGGLGSWGLEASGECAILGSGVYSIRDGEHVQTKLRGFRESKRFNLFDLLEQYGSKSSIPITSRSPVTLGEFVYRIGRLTSYTLNMWLNRDKNISINFDSKRAWDRDFTDCSDVLHSQIDSLPLTIG